MIPLMYFHICFFFPNYYDIVLLYCHLTLIIIALSFYVCSLFPVEHLYSMIFMGFFGPCFQCKIIDLCDMVRAGLK